MNKKKPALDVAGKYFLSNYRAIWLA